MADLTNFFNQILVFPFINVLVVIYQALYSLHIPFALGFSIIILTIIIRIILYPLTNSQLKSSKKMQELSHHVSKIKEKHKGDAKRLQAETMKLYKEHGVNPMSGCLTALVQFPFLMALYSVLNKIVGLNSNTIVSEINKIIYLDLFKLKTPWDPYFFGLSLAQTPSHLMQQIGPLILLIPLSAGVFQFIQSKMMFAKPVGASSEEKNQKKGGDFTSALQTQSLYMFPAMIIYFSYIFPLGLSLYWNTLTIFGILQQYKIGGWGGLEVWIKKISSKGK